MSHWGSGEATEAVLKKRLVFVINSIGYGGAERALSNILNGIGDHRERFDVHLVLLDRCPEVRDLPAYATKHVLDSRGSLLRSLILLSLCLARLRPALVVSLLVRANVASAFASALLRVPVIICERMHLTSHFAGKYRGLTLLAVRLMPRLAYRFATVALGVSTGVTADLVDGFGVSRRRARTIFNPYNLAEIRRDAALPPEFALPDRFLVAVGRFDPAKNFAQLIEAYVAAGLPQILVILGEGPERAALETVIKDCGGQGRILLPGYARNPFAVVGRAEFYVSASLNEGFPNAMVEAMVLGRPVVASDCCSGPAEILAGVPRLNAADMVEADYGILVPEGSVEALTAGLRRMNERELRERYAPRAVERAEQFNSQVVALEYWTLFDEVVEG